MTVANRTPTSTSEAAQPQFLAEVIPVWQHQATTEFRRLRRLDPSG